MLTIYFDGANAKDNASWGAVFYNGNHEIKRIGGLVREEKITNNVAEFHALKMALEICDPYLKALQTNKVTIKGDSQLVINQVKGDWKVKSETSKKYVPEIQKLLKDKEAKLIWVSREQNKEADSICNHFLGDKNG